MLGLNGHLRFIYTERKRSLFFDLCRCSMWTHLEAMSLSFQYKRTLRITIGAVYHGPLLMHPSFFRTSTIWLNGIGSPLQLTSTKNTSIETNGILYRSVKIYEYLNTVGKVCSHSPSKTLSMPPCVNHSDAVSINAMSNFYGHNTLCMNRP